MWCCYHEFCRLLGFLEPFSFILSFVFTLLKPPLESLEGNHHNFHVLHFVFTFLLILEKTQLRVSHSGLFYHIPDLVSLPLMHFHYVFGYAMCIIWISWRTKFVYWFLIDNGMKPRDSCSHLCSILFSVLLISLLWLNTKLMHV